MPPGNLPTMVEGRVHSRAKSEDSGQEWHSNTSSPERSRRSLERPNDLRGPPQRLQTIMQRTIRPVTPDVVQEGQEEKLVVTEIARPPVDLGSPQVSPRSVPTGINPLRARARGIVASESHSSESLEGGGRPSPSSAFARPRTRTIDESFNHSHSSSVSRTRTRVSSMNSTSSPYRASDSQPTLHESSSLGYPSITRSSTGQLHKSGSLKGRRLVKKGAASRPTSPAALLSDVPSIDSLKFPIATNDASKILILMKNLCGRMRGQLEYQMTENGPWSSGVCYIDESSCSLMQEGDAESPFGQCILKDLRGCRVWPRQLPEKGQRCLGLTKSTFGTGFRMVPVSDLEYDLWLAALLSWQQIKSGEDLTNSSNTSLPSTGERPSGRRESNTGMKNKEGNIIKVAKVLLWDKGPSADPKSFLRRASTRDLSYPASSWRRVSCILQDNGELKLYTENDVTLLSIIQLSQLSRCAIQRLDKSVLETDFCIAIFPHYTSTSTQLSIFRPVYIALEARILFEVWFVLLRAFCIPDIYGPHQVIENDEDDKSTTSNDPPMTSSDMFRIEKSLVVRIIEAKVKRPIVTNSGRLTKPDEDSSVGEYFAEVVLDGEVRMRTMTKSDKRNNPFWREDCEIFDLPAYIPRISIVLKQVERREMNGAGFRSSASLHPPEIVIEHVCGTVDIAAEKLERGQDNEAWWPILDDKQENIGEMFLKIRHDELVVLLAQQYKPLQDMLQRYSSGLTVQISQIMPKQLKPLSEILINIFQVSGSSGEWLMSLIEEEIDGIGKETPSIHLRWNKRAGSNESFSSASEREHVVREMGKSLSGEANLLFRGNSLLTQTLDFHMRRLGKEYLEDVLSDRISEINVLNPDCEVDPSRIERVEDLSKNWALLISLTTHIWNEIASSASRCPSELRQILKYIRAVAEDRYGDFLRVVTYTSVSGFLFLRFFCPAILNPKLFGILRDHPQQKAQRTLTLVAKSLQALSNLSAFGKKETWMEPMNSFLTGHRQNLKNFIDTVCSLPGDRNGSAQPASYSTPITILARLPPTSREGFPSLPFLIDQSRNYAALVKLWLEVNQHRITSGSLHLEGELSEFHRICVDLQRRTDECLQKAEQGEKIIDPSTSKWEDIVESFEKSTLHDIPTPTESDTTPQWSELTTTITGGLQATENSSQNRNENSGTYMTSKGERRINTPGFWEAYFGKDNKYQRPHSKQGYVSQVSSPTSSSSKLQFPVGNGDSSSNKDGSSKRSENKGQAKNFLKNLTRKNKGDKLKDSNTPRGDKWDGKERDTAPTPRGSLDREGTPGTRPGTGTATPVKEGEETGNEQTKVPNPGGILPFSILP